MRATIGHLLRSGRTADQVRDFFVARFGPTILLTPQGRGIDVLAWIVPALLGAFGLGLLGFTLRRWSRQDARATDGSPVSEADREFLARELREAGAEVVEP